MRKWITLSIALPVISAVLLFASSGVSVAGKPDQSLYKKATERFERLKKDHRKRRYRDQWERVISGFESVARKYPKSPYAGYAMFGRAEAAYGMYRVSRTGSDLKFALGCYDEFIDGYPDNENIPEALNMAGSINLELGDREAAARRYFRLANEFTSSIYAQDAKKRLKSLPRVEPEVRGAESIKGLNRVVDIRHWSNPDFTKVVIEIEGEFTFEKNQIKNPDRLYFDISGAFINSPLKDRPIDINDGILKAIRTSQYNQDTVRVVLDLASVDSYKTLMLPDPPRLVIDVTGTGAGKKDEPPKQLFVKTEKPPAKDDKPLTLSQQLGLCVATIIIDPGHGGKDPGAIGRKGLREKDVVLDVGLRLRDIVQRELGCKVVMTRDTDRFVNLDDRPGIAIKNDADLFISIHANASRNRRARGAETYLLNTTKDRNIMELAARENLTTMKKMSDTYMILKDLLLDNKREDSLRLAHAVQASLVKHSKMVDKGVKQGPFLVLYGAETPSILTEVGFISNPDEEKLLKSPEYRQKLAEGIFEGIKEYISNTKVPSYNAAL